MTSMMGARAKAVAREGSVVVAFMAVSGVKGLKSAAGDDDRLRTVLIESGGGGEQGDSAKKDGGGEGDLVTEFHMDDAWFQRVDARRGGTCAESGKFFSGLPCRA